MAKTRKIIDDLGSEQVKLLQEQVNRLTAVVDALSAAAVTAAGDGDALAVAIAALDVSDLETLTSKPTLPAGPRIPTV
jgi:hypothetical protein